MSPQEQPWVAMNTTEQPWLAMNTHEHDTLAPWALLNTHQFDIKVPWALLRTHGTILPCSWVFLRASECSWARMHFHECSLALMYFHKCLSTWSNIYWQMLILRMPTLQYLCNILGKISPKNKNWIFLARATSLYNPFCSWLDESQTFLQGQCLLT